MAKVVSRRRNQTPRRRTNWVLIGGIAVLGLLVLFALLFATLQGQGEPTATAEEVTSLVEYCEANEENCVVKGSADAPVTVVELSDYGCTHCRDFNLEGTADALDEAYVQTNQVRWISLPYASSSTTLPAAEAALCAAEQDRYFEYHKAMFGLFGSAGAYSRDGILAAGRDAGLDLDAFEACVNEGRYEGALQQNLTTAVNAGLRVTPTFFIDGRKVEGNLPLASFEQQLDSALES